MGENAEAMAHYAQAEPMKRDLGLRAIRRKQANSWHYFMANLTPNDISGEVTLAVPFKSATWFDPLTGDIMPAFVKDGKVSIALRSGESRILQTSSALASPQFPPHTSLSPLSLTPSTTLSLNGPWTLAFTEEVPRVSNVSISMTISLDVPGQYPSSSIAVMLSERVRTHCASR